MSRNLMRTSCHACPSPRVTLVEAPRLMRAEECRPYTEYLRMIVANAECPQCGAKYLAWVRNSPHGQCDEESEYSDLSYRSSFNDEPGVDDMPIYEVERIVTYRRVREIPRCPNGMDLDRADHRNCRSCQWDEKVDTAEDKWGVWIRFPPEEDMLLWRCGPYVTMEEAMAIRDDRIRNLNDPRRVERYGRSSNEYVVQQFTAELVEKHRNPRRRRAP